MMRVSLDGWMFHIYTHQGAARSLWQAVQRRTHSISSLGLLLFYLLGVVLLGFCRFFLLLLCFLFALVCRLGGLILLQ